MKKQWKWATGVVVFCILTPIIVAVNSMEMRFRAVDDGAEAVSHFLSALNAHDYAAAHALLAPPQQAALSVTAVQRAQEQIEQKHGHWASHALPNEYQPNTALNEITYYYTRDCEQNETMPLMVRVGRTSTGWRVLEYRYDASPA